MANLNTTDIADKFLGDCQRVYHQDLTSHGNQPRLKMDKLGAGDFIFVDTVPAGQNPTHSYEQKGLLVSVERPESAPSNVTLGHHAAISGENIIVPERFVLTGTFIEPKKVSLIPDQPPPDGIYAPTILLSFGTLLTGATSQFRPSGLRLNTPRIASDPANQPQRRDIDPTLYNKVIDPQNPSPFTLILHVQRGDTASVGNAMLFVGAEEADSFAFEYSNGLTSATHFDNIRIGIGTANGTNYRASVYVTEFEIWAPTPNQ
jgi:hypothetical protein